MDGFREQYHEVASGQRIRTLRILLLRQPTGSPSVLTVGQNQGLMNDLVFFYGFLL